MPNVFSTPPQQGTVRTSCAVRVVTRRIAAALSTACLAIALLVAATQALAEAPNRSARYSGTYRIEGWQALEGRGLYQFFYLHPSGKFLLGSEWAGNENSLFAGSWSVSDGMLFLNGRGDVRTNQGEWKVQYVRSFRITASGEGFRLTPVPEKNRFGMLGWPNPFLFHRRLPAPNLPALTMPKDEPAFDAYILKHLRRLGLLK